MKEYNRRMHLIDIENQLGSGHISHSEISGFFEFYRERVTVGEQDQVVVAVSSQSALLELALSSMCDFRMLYWPGRNGADLALQAVMTMEGIDLRFPSVVCASGDGGFIDAVVHLTSRNTRVIVAAPLRSTATKLRLAAHLTIDLTTQKKMEAA